MLVIAGVFSDFRSQSIDRSLSSSIYHKHITTIPTQLSLTLVVSPLRLLPSLKMPITWDAANSMQMLLLVIAEADIKPSASTWTKVASKLGDITPSAVRYDLSGWTTLRAFAAQHFNLLKSWPQISFAHIEFFCLYLLGIC